MAELTPVGRVNHQLTKCGSPFSFSLPSKSSVTVSVPDRNSQQLWPPPLAVCHSPPLVSGQVPFLLILTVFILFTCFYFLILETNFPVAQAGLKFPT